MIQVLLVTVALALSVSGQMWVQTLALERAWEKLSFYLPPPPHYKFIRILVSLPLYKNIDFSHTSS
jgi:hypothetical protein